eukprot:CAMPEP_0171620664 /NCGR_PEP_ID=MMETSP0990-20121206/16128_1 /TAXON_ID=483369 /ORGANISM="non described non described, Strain CCMP2098" /LENGTH=177 /DNA_ID=CAMNT_0012186005 /DNA_START=213 /DNA_END=743 /DNA_ORIENTATION=+
MSMALIFGTALAVSIGGPFVEKNRQEMLPAFLFEQSTTLPAVTKGFGVVVVLLFIYSFWFTMLGFSVGGMRSKYRELAKKDGEKDCEDRYGLPNLYVEGNTKWAKAFNCTQRAHQQQLETLTQFYVCILLSALQFPVSASVLTLMSLFSRYVWASAYTQSDGDPSKRYDHPLSKFAW